MALMKQEDMRVLIKGAWIFGGSGSDTLSNFLPEIAIAAIGDDIEELRRAVNDYLNEATKLFEGSEFLNEASRLKAVKYLNDIKGFVFA